MLILDQAMAIALNIWMATFFAKKHFMPEDHKII